MKTLTLLLALLAATLTRAQHDPSDAIDHILQSRAAAGDFSGAALVARDGHILYEHAFCFANQWVSDRTRRISSAMSRSLGSSLLSSRTISRVPGEQERSANLAAR